MSFYDTKPFSYYIKTTWDNRPVQHNPVNIQISDLNGELCIEFKAPFFNSPGKPNKTIDEVFNLYDYEVVEVFFLNDAGQYLEVEFGPFGHYLILTLDGYRNLVNEGLRLEDFNTTLNESYKTYTVRAIIPEAYLPYKVTKWNAYAIHGEGDDRVYESLFPVPTCQFENPDFHRLEYFKPIEFQCLPSLIQNHEKNTNDNKFWSKQDK